MIIAKLRPAIFLLASLVCALSPASGALQVLDAFYRPDRALPEFNYLWNSGFKPGDTPPNYILSGGLCVYLRNTGGASVTLDDVSLQGISLKRAFGCNTSKTYRDGLAYACSIHIPSSNPISAAERQTLIDAGEPIWYRFDPDVVAPGQTAELYIRMRLRVPATLSLAIQPLGMSSIPVSITVSDSDVPRVAGYAISPTMNRLYLYFRHPQKGMSPTQILLDGQDITASSTIGSDPGMDVIPVACNLSTSLNRGSYHTFQAVYADGTKATAGARVYSDDFYYGVWGGPPSGWTTQQYRAYVESLGRRSINLQVLGANGANDYMKSTEGLALLDQLGIWRLHSDPDKAFGRLYGLFLCDEPDAGDAAVPSTVVPTYAQVGTLAGSLVTRAKSFRSSLPTIPNVLNLNSTFKPHNWYIYGQIPDIFSVDPYYQTRLADSYWSKPHQIPIYTKAYYIYGVSSVCKAACEPKPLHVILSCTRRQDGSRVFRWGTPEEKRIELYYGLAGGAKQFAYWWVTPISATTSGSSGCIDDEPEAAALWREIGLLGAEARTAGPAIVRSCPASISVGAPSRLWVRGLIAGLDTLILICVNDDYANDRAGTVLNPIEHADLSVSLPAWLNPSQVFEVDYKGIHDVVWSKSGSSLNMQLGRVEVTRMIIITSDPGLRNTMQNLYSTRFGPNVSQLIRIH